MYKTNGVYVKTRKYLKNSGAVNRVIINSLVDMYTLALETLFDITPKDTSKTASSWETILKQKGDLYILDLINNNVIDDVNIARVLMFGFSHYYSGTYTPPNIDLYNFVSEIQRESLKKIREFPKHKNLTK